MILVRKQTRGGSCVGLVQHFVVFKPINIGFTLVSWFSTYLIKFQKT
jgi:hypothetical protein